MKSALDFILKSTREKMSSEDIYFQLINQWTEDRGSLETMAIYDMDNKPDFVYMVEKYGVKGAVDYFYRGRFYFDGMDYKEPTYMSVSDMVMSIEQELDLEYFMEAKEKFGTIDYWNRWLDVEAIEKEISNHTFGEVRCDYFDEEKDVYYVDAWKTANPNEEGIVVATINSNTYEVVYTDDKYKTIPIILEVIKEKLHEITE